MNHIFFVKRTEFLGGIVFIEKLISFQDEFLGQIKYQDIRASLISRSFTVIRVKRVIIKEVSFDLIKVVQVEKTKSF